MRKIIAAIDGLRPSTSTRDFAIELASKTKSLLVAVFLDDFGYNSYRIYDLISEESVNITVQQEKLELKDAKTRSAAVADFEKACKTAGIDYLIHHDQSFAIQELIRESIYADLLVIDKSETLTNHPEKPPTMFIRQLLADAQCPVLVVPHVYTKMEKIIFLYDGDPSSVYAIKMFDYTFSSLLGTRSETLFVNQLPERIQMPEDKLMKEFMDNHLPGTKYIVLHGDPESTILRRLKKEEGSTLVVLGAYKRSKVSRWFRPSMADILLEETKVPLFIAHNK
ncbi:MAG: universal stress protein [Chitinophagaceae bacterium]|nr:MAG: universal stress protein [Chitinophagaceae bacterium]